MPATGSIINKDLHYSSVILVILVASMISIYVRAETELQTDVPCLENERFYRDPNRSIDTIWTVQECSRYFLCLDGEVFEFRCTKNLLFDIIRQICDFKPNVDNCDITTVPTIPNPLLEKANCDKDDHLGCADGTCIPGRYFCDGSLDCQDGSDEKNCSIKNDRYATTPCNTTSCKLPDCFCSSDGTQIPGNLKASETPQMILLTFDDAINHENWDLYSRVLFTEDLQNPNGCPIRGTFFVSHQYNNYQQTQKLWNDGHEIGIHSITHRGPEDWWSENATIEDWFDEMIGEANILHRYSKIRMNEIRGIRVPFLKIGWNRQFLMMKEFGFLYDSSMVAPVSDLPLWPYTLDHKLPHACTEEREYCPTRSYPNLWEMVINQLDTGKFASCPTIDACPKDLSGDDVYRMLVHNFKRHYLTNRAPYGLHFHSSWFKNQEYLIAIQKFLDNMMQYPDVWFVSNWQAIQWMKNPTRSDDLNGFDYWNCKRHFETAEIACDKPNVCKLYSSMFQEQRLLYTCSECPEKYPWIRNEFGVE